MNPDERATVIVANGEWDTRTLRVAAFSAAHIVVCDGAADRFLAEIPVAPDLVIGDCDSISSESAARLGERLCKVPSQEDNDLSKAFTACRERGWDANMVVYGACGRREDHSLGNIFRALEAGARIKTPYGTFTPVDDAMDFQTREGSAVSIFATDPETQMESTGLVWPLEGVKFENLYCATLNKTCAENFTVKTNRRVYVYVAKEA